MPTETLGGSGFSKDADCVEQHHGETLTMQTSARLLLQKETLNSSPVTDSIREAI